MVKTTLEESGFNLGMLGALTLRDACESAAWHRTLDTVSKSCKDRRDCASTLQFTFFAAGPRIQRCALMTRRPWRCAHGGLLGGLAANGFRRCRIQSRSFALFHSACAVVVRLLCWPWHTAADSRPLWPACRTPSCPACTLLSMTSRVTSGSSGPSRCDEQGLACVSGLPVTMHATGAGACGDECTGWFNRVGEKQGRDEKAGQVVPVACWIWCARLPDVNTLLLCSCCSRAYCTCCSSCPRSLGSGTSTRISGSGG